MPHGEFRPVYCWDQHREGGLYSRQRGAPDAQWRLRDWALCLRSRECDATRWFLVAVSWDCDWRRSKCPWGSFYILVQISQQDAVARLHVDESVRPNETSSGSSECWSRQLTIWKHLSCEWCNPARHSFCAASWTASKLQHLFPRQLFTSSRVPFSGHCLWHLPFCRLTRVRKLL